MNYLFFIKCFFLGVSSTLGLGPIFLLIVRKSTLQGRFHGLATAIGAALGDGLFFSLALMGALNFIKEYHGFITFAAAISGLAIIIFGMLMMQAKPRHRNVAIQEKDSLVITMIQALLLTLLSPFVAIFFMVASIQVLPHNYSPTLHSILFGGFAVTLGSLLGLSTIALTAGSLSTALSSDRMSRISFFSGLLFIAIGAYFLGSALYEIIWAFAQ